MKKIAILLLLVVLFPVGTAAQDRVLRISSGEWAPWSGENAPDNGFVCHVVKLAFSRKGYDVRYEFFPWKRSYDMLLNGEVDASAFWYESEARKAECFYSDAVNTEKMVLFHLKTTHLGNWETLRDLGKYSFGVTRGLTYTDELWRLGSEGVLQFEVTNNLTNNFAMLLRERVDIVPASLLYGLSTLRRHFPPDIAATSTYHFKPLRVATGHLLFLKGKKGSKELLATFNAGLAELMADGTYQTLRDRLLAGGYSR